MTTGPTTFEQTRNRRTAAMVFAAGAVGLGVVGVVLVTTGTVLPGAALIVAGVVDLGIAWWWSTSGVRSVTIDPEGIRVTPGRGQQVLLPWRDVGGWAIGQPVAGTVVQNSVNQALLVWPADHVTAPRSHPFWLSGGGCWQVCRLPEIVGSADEVRAAMLTYAPTLERARQEPDSEHVQGGA